MKIDTSKLSLLSLTCKGSEWAFHCLHCNKLLAKGNFLTVIIGEDLPTTVILDEDIVHTCPTDKEDYYPPLLIQREDQEYVFCEELVAGLLKPEDWLGLKILNLAELPLEMARNIILSVEKFWKQKQALAAQSKEAQPKDEQSKDEQQKSAG